MENEIMGNEKEKLNETMNVQDILLKNGELNIDVIPETMNPEQFIDLLKRSLYPLCKDYQEK